ncbi:hypothetical protein GGX14DRAFT_620332 [Mycena pura]|uniref:Protein SQS1 n=1 Tax=Mycena pura TaxID=153505 RepID=A0AAD6VLM6_9AGAR|nr:hypothetical protein GGX14DRAFT_620332 [Mycena pura]
MFRGSPNNNRGRGSRAGSRGGQHDRGRGRARGAVLPTTYPLNRIPSSRCIRIGSRGRGLGSPARGNESPRGRGRGRGDFNSPRERGRGRGRGRGAAKFRADAPLSELLYGERPLLKPIKFVPSVHHPTLFQEEEELLQPGVEDVGDQEQSHVPTAERVARVFSGGSIRRIDTEDEEESLEEIDFSDLSKLREEVDALAAQSKTPSVAVEAVEERFTGIFLNKPRTAVDSLTPEDTPDDPSPSHIIESTPYDEEIIVYIAPHPRAGRAASPSPPPVEPPSLSSTSILTGATLSRTTPPPEFASVSFAFTPSPKKPPRQAPVLTVHDHKKARLKARQLARRIERRATAASSFGALGALVSEARLRGVDPRHDERRRGDSDVDWGDEDNDREADEESGGMDVDVELDVKAMQRFAMGMSAEGSAFVTMDDIQDAQRMLIEDAGGPGSSEDEDEDESSEEEDEDEVRHGSEDDDDEADAIVEAEEALMVAEPRDLLEDDSEEEDSDDVDQSPRSGFQARLDRLRKAARERRPDDSLDLLEGDSDDDDFLQQTWAEADDDFAAQIQGILDENGDILSATSRQGRKELYKAVANGEIVDFEGFGPASKNKRNGLPPELQAMWDNDRAKKAENKRLRALARLEAAADPLAQHKRGKKGRKAMLAAARLDPTITVLPNRVIDMTTLVQQIRRFIADIGGPTSMSLPPTDKATRKNIHEMAIAFNLKSVSKGKGDARYTTLSKTTRTGFGVAEAKVARIARRGAGGRGGAAFVRDGGGEKGKGRAGAMPRHRDGDEVGKAAPKIGESNIGFKMLTSMGWADGQRIGAAADGLHAPLTAVIKNTKLGLGATR